MIRYHTKAEIAAVRAKYPGFWICEVVARGETCLLAIPPNEENASRAVPLLGDALITGAMLDGACFINPHLHQ